MFESLGMKLSFDWKFKDKIEKLHMFVRPPLNFSFSSATDGGPHRWAGFQRMDVATREVGEIAGYQAEALGIFA